MPSTFPVVFLFYLHVRSFFFWHFINIFISLLVLFLFVNVPEQKCFVNIKSPLTLFFRTHTLLFWMHQRSPSLSTLSSVPILLSLLYLHVQRCSHWGIHQASERRLTRHDRRGALLSPRLSTHTSHELRYIFLGFFFSLLCLFSSFNLRGFVQQVGSVVLYY